MLPRISICVAESGELVGRQWVAIAPYSESVQSLFEVAGMPVGTAVIALKHVPEFQHDRFEDLLVIRLQLLLLSEGIEMTTIVPARSSMSQ